MIEKFFLELAQRMELAQKAAIIVPAVIGGAIDWLNQVQEGRKRGGFWGGVLHVATAAFFGWIVGTIAADVGYSQKMVGVAGGIGGYLGVSTLKIVLYRFVGGGRK